MQHCCEFSNLLVSAAIYYYGYIVLTTQSHSPCSENAGKWIQRVCFSQVHKPWRISDITFTYLKSLCTNRICFHFEEIPNTNITMKRNELVGRQRCENPIAYTHTYTPNTHSHLHIDSVAIITHIYSLCHNNRSLIMSRVRSRCAFDNYTCFAALCT